MERGSKLILGGLGAAIALAFVTLGPGRTLYEPAAAQDMPSGGDDYVSEDQPGYEPDPVLTTIELQGNRTGYTDPDPLEDAAPVTAPPPAPRTERTISSASRAAAAPRSRDAEPRGERGAAAASGLDDGDISTTGDLAF